MKGLAVRQQFRPVISLLLLLAAGPGCLSIIAPPLSQGSQNSPAGGGAGEVTHCQLANQFVTIKDFDPVVDFGANSAAGINQIIKDSLGNLYGSSYVWLNNYASSEAAVYKSADGGISWTIVSTIPNVASPYLSADNSGRIFLVAQGTTQTVATYVSTDQAASWTLVDSFLDATYTAGAANKITVDNQGHVISVGYQKIAGLNNASLARMSSDNGAHWTAVPGLDLDPLLTPGANTTLLNFNIDAFGNWYTLASTGDGATTGTWYILKSSDQGQNWSTLDSLITTTTGGTNLNYTAPWAMIMERSGNLIAVGSIWDTGGLGHWVIRVSTDGGAHWTNQDDTTAVAGGWDGSAAETLTQDATGNLYVGGEIDMGSDGAGGDNALATIRRSTDGGLTWTTIDSLHLSGASKDSSSFGSSITDSSGQVFFSGYDYLSGHSYIRALLCQ